MNTNEKDDIFVQKAREAFLASVAGLDPEVLGRLRAARVRAVEAVGQKTLWFQGWRLPAGAAAVIAVGVLGTLLWMGLGASPAPTPFSSASTDAPMMMTGDSMDMYADMDFYQWMAAQEDQAQKPQEPTDQDQDDSDDDGDVGG